MLKGSWYKRSLAPPSKSFFLFGPRGTGKSTWVKEHFPTAHYFDLLQTRNFLRFQIDPSLFRKEVEALSAGQWVVIDEVQKLPILLDEVHSLIEEKKIRFVLTGSSARKLKRQSTNLLAGRAITKNFFPLTAEEMGADFDLSRVLEFGSLPAVICSQNLQEKIEFLEAYANTYLKEEIQQEALVKNLSSFTKFISVAALF